MNLIPLITGNLKLIFFNTYILIKGNANPFIILNEVHECGMMLFDPITNLNVAKSTFKIDQIKSVLTKGVVNIRNVINQKAAESNNNYNNNIINIKKTYFLEELFKIRNKVLINNLIEPM